MTLVHDLPDLETPTPGYDVVVVPEVVEGVVIYVARHPDLPHVLSQGHTPDEALADLEVVREEYLADMRQAGIPVPGPKLSPTTHRLELGATDQRTSVPIEWRVKRYRST